MTSNDSVLTRKNAPSGPLDDDLELLALEPLAQGVGDLHFVFDDENSHPARDSRIGTR